MQFTKLGQTGLTVSRMILGTVTFGKQTDEKEAHRMLDKAADAGIKFIDTADVYPPGAEVLAIHDCRSPIEIDSLPSESVNWTTIPAQPCKLDQ
jgi:aryl-alcohol dehydrogenase-like predicted oxidoreductase